MTTKLHRPRKRRLKVLRTSERLSFRRCPKQWEWGYLDGWQSKDGAQALWMGTGVHEALATYYKPGTKRGPHPTKTWLKYCDREHEMVRIFRDEGPEYIEARDLGVAMLDGYVQHWGGDESWNVVQPEWKARVRVLDENEQSICFYHLTVDGVYFDREDRKFKVMEHKTAARVQMFKYEMDDQAGSYPPFISAKLIEEGVIKRPIRKITYNILRKDVPKPDDRPVNDKGERLNKDGSVSKNQSAQAPLFVRDDFDRTPAHDANQIRRIASEVRAMNEMEEDRSRIYKNPSADCSWCPFLGPCQLHEAGGEWLELMQWENVQGDPYDAYNTRKVA